MVTSNNRQASPSTLLMVAALNEEEGIGLTLAEAGRFLNGHLCLVVDGGSRDHTVGIARSNGAVVIRQEGLGKGDAIRTGIVYASGLDFKYVIFVDADYTYPAEYMPKMIRTLEKNPHVGMVCGNRFGQESHLSSMKDIFYIGNRLIAFTHNFFNGVNLKDPLTGMRVIRWDIIKEWKPESKGFDIEVELNHRVEKKGFEIVEIPIHYRQRLGEKKLELKHGFTIFRRIVLERFKESVGD